MKMFTLTTELKFAELCVSKIHKTSLNPCK